MLELKNISKTFNIGTVNEQTLFTGFSLTVEKGDFISVVGSNGSGKTTMLNIISGSIPVDSGSVILDGEDITKLPEFRPGGADRCGGFRSFKPARSPPTRGAPPD